MKVTAKDISRNLVELGNSTVAEHSQRFFKTGKGEYGEGDKFLGIRVPIIRKQVKKYKDISLEIISNLLKSSYHEVRLFAVLMLVRKFSNGDDREKSKIYSLYMNSTKYVNNWDLVDSSASYIVGAYLADKDKQPIYDMAKSESLWERRISIMSTFHFIRNNDFSDALKISEILIDDREDLIHKAVGWMLREIGNRSLAIEEEYLKEHYKKMPRTMLRYSIEKLPKEKRKAYLTGTM
ncbi:MAG: DNA alkylation repair protein [Calditrichaeota bacterium]|jgi:3-methyladenine DNA glycosylase AlkD|nr:DNA alkylation repair protein [Deltaproteobacteria bacterium]MBT7616544.1 DNA alkylation repair protein [Calditrichota bacterium]MBT4091976.1 DNA alkylation repair protein [Deltaproteobacteria bacterium]MBT4266775.1 DNA alkylation repair protein [Deltaproteobacteria bacterium]MBT4643739.1 DNA alkylation repair protein [Deltaproteobacteria bacterium]